MRMLARSSRQALAASQHPTSRRTCCPQCGLPSSTTSLPSSSPRAASSTASVAPAAAARGFLASRHAGPQSAVMQGTSLRGSMTTARATSSSSSSGSGGGSIETFDKAPPFSLHGFPPLYLRRSLEAMVGRESFKAAGVTFNERQEAVSQVVAGQPVLLQRQPWNEYDSGAVTIRTLQGTDLGFVPREINPRFQHHDIILAWVDFVGQDPGSGKWGMRVSAHPRLMSAYVSPFNWQLLPSPSSATPAGRGVGAGAAGAKGRAVPQQLPAPAMAGLAALREALGAQRWQQLSDEAAERSKGLCEVTAAGGELQPLVEVPEWHFDEPGRVVQLRRLALVSEDIAMVRFALDLPPFSPACQHTLQTLIAVNGWGRGGGVNVERAQAYVQAVGEQREALVGQGWRLEL